MGSYLADGDGDRVPRLIMERERLVVTLLIGRLFRQVVSPDVQPPVPEAIYVRVVVTLHGLDLGRAWPPLPVPGCTSIRLPLAGPGRGVCGSGASPPLLTEEPGETSKPQDTNQYQGTGDGGDNHGPGRRTWRYLTGDHPLAP